MIRAIAGASPAERQAIEWLIRLQDPQAEVEPFIEFQAWLESRPENRLAYDRVQSLWNELGDAELRRALAWRRPPLLTRRAVAAGGVSAIAAGLAVVIGGRSLGGAEEIYQAAPGEGQAITLKDGSTLDLKPGAEVRVRLGWRKRDAVLTRGEALFDIAHDEDRPFKVRVDDHQIDVLGTAFAVRQRTDGFQVTVLRGLVRVSPQDGGAEGVAMVRGDHYDQRKGLSARLVKGEPQEIAEWRAGRRIYRDSPLPAVVADLNAALDGPVTLDPAAASIRFSGVLHIEDGASVLRQLETLLPIRALPAGDGVKLVPRDI